MQYRTFGKTDWQASVLGFGCMRLPTIDGKPQSQAIDEPLVIRMVRHAIDNGVNYLDTAYPYHEGRSEVVLGKALQDGYRQRVKVATKFPTWLLTETADFDKYLNEQLERLQLEQIDLYLLHGLSKTRWKKVLELRVLEAAERAQRDGRIGSLGFSFHDRHTSFPEIIDGYDGWDFCQIQYNYLDVENLNQAGKAGLHYAAAKGLAAVVMEPLLGGRLAQPPSVVKTILDQSAIRRSAVEWALGWLWDQSEVSVILSGMSSMEQVEENLAYANQAQASSFGPAEQETIGRVQSAYQSLIPIPCTNCGYCMPCPQGVNIPRNFKLYNDGIIHENLSSSSRAYLRFMPAAERAAECIRCRQCEPLCPQQIEINDWMPKVDTALGEKGEVKK
jgi:predicted aldo/keto reductase-like oxidoreductase